MKHLILMLALLGTLPAPARSDDDDALAARELAHHLGVSSWTSKLHLQGADVRLEILHVKNGKVVLSIYAGSIAATDREFTRVAIQASATPSGTKLSVQSPGGAWSRNQYATSIPLNVIVPMPRILAEGDYVLGGDIPSEKLGQDKPPLKIEDLKDGLLLRVTKGA